MENHPYFVQQLALEVWYNTKIECSEQTVHDSVETVLNKNHAVYHREIENLTMPQIEFLKALSHGETAFTSVEVLKKYKIGTSSNVKRIKESLVNREIIEIWVKKTEISDPLFNIWIKKNLKI